MKLGRTLQRHRPPYSSAGTVMTMTPVLLVLPMLLAPLHAVAQQRLPIIDMHLHAHGAEWAGRSLPVPICVPVVAGPSCPDTVWSPATDDGIMQQTIAALERHNIIGVLSQTPERVRRWSDAGRGRFIPALRFDLVRDADITPDSIRRLVQTGAVKVLGEILNQYVGIAPDDERMEPYWALAEELHIPVAIHMGEGYPGAPYLGSPRYRARLGNPLLLEEVLVRHPRLRVYVMHYGSPLVDEMIAVLYTYPQVYVDIGGIQWTYPREYFYGQLKKLIDAGFGKRVMFGSDQMIWPAVIERAIAIVQEAPFLSKGQKRDIFYNNAARFLRFSQEEIAKHHRN